MVTIDGVSTEQRNKCAGADIAWAKKKTREEKGTTEEVGNAVRWVAGTDGSTRTSRHVRDSLYVNLPKLDDG